MNHILGEFIEVFPPEHDCLELTFAPSSRPLKNRWRINRLSAYFVADYLSTFLPINEDEASSILRLKQSKGAITYIANELLENAMKFNDPTINRRVKFGIHFIEGAKIIAVIFATNNITSEGQNKFESFIQELLNSDPDELYISQVEKSAEEDSESSGLGLLTMINDYSAKLGWKFEAIQEEPQVFAVTTMAQIAV